MDLKERRLSFFFGFRYGWGKVTPFINNSHKEDHVKYWILLGFSLFSLSSCQSKDAQVEREGNFEQMVILEEDYSIQPIEKEDQIRDIF
jgi:hypothetical protein